MDRLNFDYNKLNRLLQQKALSTTGTQIHTCFWHLIRKNPKAEAQPILTVVI